MRSGGSVALICRRGFGGFFLQLGQMRPKRELFSFAGYGSIWINGAPFSPRSLVESLSRTEIYLMLVALQQIACQSSLNRPHCCYNISSLFESIWNQNKYGFFIK